MTNDFLLKIVQRLEAASFPIWIFGGWAEELWQIFPTRPHNDIDFLYRGEAFEHLDSFFAQSRDMREVQEKRFSHKRAIILQDVMIEFLLVQQGRESYFTDFFSGRYRLKWPADVFSYMLRTGGYDIQIASKQALRSYRQQHQKVEQAYQDFLLTIRE